jgi:seryl-tRNA synthetase
VDDRVWIALATGGGVAGMFAVLQKLLEPWTQRRAHDLETQKLALEREEALRREAEAQRKADGERREELRKECEALRTRLETAEAALRAREVHCAQHGDLCYISGRESGKSGGEKT